MINLLLCSLTVNPINVLLAQLWLWCRWTDLSVGGLFLQTFVPSPSAPSKATSIQKRFPKLRGEFLFHPFKVFLCVSLNCLTAALGMGSHVSPFAALLYMFGCWKSAWSVLVNASVSVHRFLRCCSSVESVNFSHDCKFHFQVLGFTAFPWCSKW